MRGGTYDIPPLYLITAIMSYIISKYVYQFISSKGCALVYCSRSNSFLELNMDLYNFMLKCKEDPNLLDELDDKLIELFISNKIMVKPDEDNDFLLEHHFTTDIISYSNRRLGLVVAPTIGCNFDCPYCFEPGKKSYTMTEEIIDDLILFIKKHKEANLLDLVWYGGEPLLAFKKIQTILRRIRDEVPIKLGNHDIITNGYYFTPQVIEFFKEFPLDTIQITFDGGRERHNNLRKQKKTGEPTYDHIIENIDRIVDELPGTQIHLRINIEKSNVNDFIEGKKFFEKRWKNKDLIVYPGILRIDNEDGTAIACSAMNKWESANFLYDINEKGVFKTDIYPKIRLAKNCCATRLNSYIVGPRGEIYKCWNDVSDDNKIVGYINQEKLTNPKLLYRYLVGSKWYANSECKECFFLPICNGNCAWYALKNIYDKGEYIICDCMQKSPEMLNKSLEYHYDMIHK